VKLDEDEHALSQVDSESQATGRTGGRVEGGTQHDMTRQDRSTSGLARALNVRGRQRSRRLGVGTLASTTSRPRWFQEPGTQQEDSHTQHTHGTVGGQAMDHAHVHAEHERHPQPRLGRRWARATQGVRYGKLRPNVTSLGTLNPRPQRRKGSPKRWPCYA
jgi:hypothetical protein